MIEKKRIGFMGGTFDPIHMGHLILAEEACRELKLDKILFVPAGRPPHKRQRKDGAENHERSKMTALAIEGNDHFELSLIEMKQERLSYSYRTLEALKAEHPEYELYFIMGADSLTEFSDWKEPERIAAACTLVAAVRSNMPREELEKAAEEVRRQYHTDVILLNMPNIEISSTVLRKRCADGEDIRYYVPDQVRQYILEKGIYRSDEED